MNSPILEALSRPEVWEAYYRYKTRLLCPRQETEALRAYMDRQDYLPVCRAIRAGEPFPLPRRAEISKLSSGKKRIVYTYPEPENRVLKLLTWILLREYDGLFAPGLYSFRPGRTAKDAIRALRRTPGLEGMYAYKADVRNYFNSVPLPGLLPELERVLGEDPALLAFLRRLLEEPLVLDRGRPIREEKGVMAGTSLACFYANLYLRELDRTFLEAGVPYARYSDDIIFFAPTETELQRLTGRLSALLAEKGLAVNPEKESRFSPGEGWTFLGFRCRGEEIDIAPATLEKLKAKMRRKTRALARWRDRTGHTGQQAAAAFIRVFNRKLLEAPLDRELSWSRWFFSVINTTASLEVIDHYAQDCLRTLVSGKRTKGRYNVRYEDLKALGYRSLVHEYYGQSRSSKD